MLNKPKYKDELKEKCLDNLAKMLKRFKVKKNNKGG